MIQKQTGDKLTAAEVNELNALAQKGSHVSGGGGVKVVNGPGGATLRGRNSNTIRAEGAIELLALNTSNTALKLFAPAAIIDHVGHVQTQRRCLKVRVPTADDAGWFVVCAEPIAPNQAGRVWVQGVCPVWLRNPSELPRAETESGAGYLVGSDEGSAQICWEETWEDTSLSPAATHLALIRFPVGGGGDGGSGARAATTAEITLAGTQVIDGVSLQIGDRVLVKDQNTLADNGVYVVNGGAWSKRGAPSNVGVTSGTKNGRLMFTLQPSNTYLSMGAVFG